MSTRVIHVRLFASLVLYLYNIHVHIWHTCPLVSHMFASIIQYMSKSTIHRIHVHPCHTCSVVRMVGIVLKYTFIPDMHTHLCRASNIQYEFIVYLVYFIRTNHSIHVHPCHTCSHPGIVLKYVHIQNTCPLVHLCHTYYISISNASKHLKGQLDPPVGNVMFFAPK